MEKFVCTSRVGFLEDHEGNENGRLEGLTAVASDIIGLKILNPRKLENK